MIKKHNHILKAGFFNFGLILIASLIFLTCTVKKNGSEIEIKKERAKQFFQNVYACNSEELKELIDDNFVSTYPAYQELFNKPGFKGKNEFINFSNGFKQRWKEGKIIFHEITAEDNRVVLLWSFSAKRSLDTDSADIKNEQKFSWGGITILYFKRFIKLHAISLKKVLSNA